MLVWTGVFKYYLDTYAGYLVFVFLNTSLTKTDISQRSLLIEIRHILLTESEYKHNCTVFTCGW